MPRHIASTGAPTEAPGPTDGHDLAVSNDPSDREARLELALDIGEIGTWSWDLATGTGDLDERGARIVGLEPGFIPDIAVAQRQRVHPDDLATLEADLKAGLAGSDVFDLEYRVVHADGSVAHVASRARVFRDRDG